MLTGSLPSLVPTVSVASMQPPLAASSPSHKYLSGTAHHSDHLTSAASSQQFHGRVCALVCPSQHRNLTLFNLVDFVKPNNLNNMQVFKKPETTEKKKNLQDLQDLQAFKTLKTFKTSQPKKKPSHRKKLQTPPSIKKIKTIKTF